MVAWIGFGLAIALLLAVSRRDLALGMAIAAATLAVFTLSPESLGGALWRTISDPSVLFLALIVGLIPMIGGAMETSGEMDRLVENLRIGVRPFLAFAPALLGMLPMPGGTLLSAPLIERAAGHTAPDVKAAANVWFRHVLLLVYPLGPALIASARVASLDVYAVIPYLVPAFLITIAVGYLFLLRRASGRLSQSGSFSLIGLVVPLAIILSAPLLDLLLSNTVDLPIAEIGTTVGVTASLVAATAVGRLGSRQLLAIFRRMKPWRYALIILAMFAFLNVFTASGVPERIAGMALPPVVLCVVVGAALGLITGRIQAPMSIILPIYAAGHGTITPATFAVTYFAVFIGYLLTPIHPCVSVSLQYFHSSLSGFWRHVAAPSAVGLAAALVAGIFVL